MHKESPSPYARECLCAARQWRGLVWSHREGQVYAHALSASLLFPKQSRAASIRGMSPPPKGQWGHCTRNHQARTSESATTGGVEASTCFFQNNLAQGIIKPLCQGVPASEVQKPPPRRTSARSEPGAPINFCRPSSMHPNCFVQPLSCSKHQR